MMSFLLSLGWTLKSAIRMVLYFGILWLVVWGLNIGMFIVQIKGWLIGIITELFDGWFITLISVIDWIITGAIAVAIAGAIVYLLGKLVEKFFLLFGEYSIIDIVPYVITVLIVFIICDPLLHFMVPDSLMPYLQSLRVDYGYSQMPWVPLETWTYSIYLEIGVIAGSVFLIRGALDDF